MTYNYNPFETKYSHVREFFSEKGESHSDLVDKIDSFAEKQNLENAREVLTEYFTKHETGDLNELRRVTSLFADKRVALNLVDSILEDEDTLEEIANRSYPHPIGFDKLVLHHHKPEKEGEQEYKLRLHIYWRTPQNLGLERTHLHSFEMASSPITGELTNHMYQLVSFNSGLEEFGTGGIAEEIRERGIEKGIVTDDAVEGREGIQKMSAYSGYFIDSVGRFHKHYLGEAEIKKTSVLTFVPGQTYVQGLESPHYVETNAETGHSNKDICSTIYIHGPYLSDDEGRNIPVLFEEERLDTDDEVITPIESLSKEDLKNSLLQYREILSESLSFYEWMYDQKHGRDLSVGMVAGYLLSEEAREYDTIRLWRENEEGCREILNSKQEIVQRVIIGGESLHDICQEDHQTRYFQQLINKAHSHPDGLNSWFKESGNLALELDRYISAVTENYSGQDNLEVLKPVWNLNTFNPRKYSSTA